MIAETEQIGARHATQWTPLAPRLLPSAKRNGTAVIKLDFNPRTGRSASAKKSSSQLFEVLAASEIFRDYRQAFEDATGLPLALRSAESWQLAHDGGRRQNGFCALMSQSNHSCAACLTMQQRVCDEANGTPGTGRCSFGLSETAVAVKDGENVLAYLQTGQVFFKRPTARQTTDALSQIKRWGLEVDLQKAARLYNETPVVKRGEYQAIVRLLEFFADQLGATASRIVLQQQSIEPTHITRVRQFIADNYQEELTLALVARQAGMSTFYFCKTFKQFTGLNFTHYVSRVRVEKAKSLLLNPHARVSEIAYAVGFQSLTHFNRVFKSMIGESPTNYRQNLQSV